MRRRVYMDGHATTPVDPRVLETMLPYFGERFGNTASRTHRFGWEALQAVDAARSSVARAIGARPCEIVFTSGATEADNLALVGAARGLRARGDHLISVVTEHRAVLDPLEHLERAGWRVTRLAVDREGRLDPAAVDSAITERTVLLSVMAANNEIGVLHDLRAIGEVSRSHSVVFHSDAAQALGKLELDVGRLNLDLVSLSSHKLHGPKGVGALYVSERLHGVLEPLMAGGGHERGLRPGTLDVPAIVGFGRAVELALELMPTEVPRLKALRDRLLRQLRESVEGIEVNGTLDARLPNNLNVSFAGVDGEALLLRLDDIALSTGSACTSASAEPSHVLRALGHGPDRVRGSIRFGLGRFNTVEQVDYVTRRIAEAVGKLRAITPPLADGGSPA